MAFTFLTIYYSSYDLIYHHAQHAHSTVIFIIHTALYYSSYVDLLYNHNSTHTALYYLLYIDLLYTIIPAGTHSTVLFIICTIHHMSISYTIITAHNSTVLFINIASHSGIKLKLVEMVCTYTRQNTYIESYTTMKLHAKHWRFLDQCHIVDS